MNTTKRFFEPSLLALLILVSLLILYIIPEFEIGGFTFKRIDILSDIKTEKTDNIQQTVADSIEHQQDSVKQLVIEQCKPGITCIEDYSGDSTALKYFFEALQKTKRNHSSLRIALYGDSFIEGDVFCGGVRDTLQSIFGGRGVGFVPITSAVTGFRNTVKHEYNNWRTYSIITKQDSIAYGPSGYTFIPLVGNTVTFEGAKQRYLHEFNTVKIYYQTLRDAAVQYSVNDDTLFLIDELTRSGSLREWKFEHAHIKKVNLEFYPFEHLKLFGASLEGEHGVMVDNFSVRGNTGYSLGLMNNDLLKSFGRYRDYKLVILQFGVNLISDDSINYKGFIKRMVSIVNKMKAAYPQASFLLLSVPDRANNKSGKPATMEAVPIMRNAQRIIAQQTKIAFWDMFDAMGGEGSMVHYVESNPPLAAKDYTHLTFKGGKKLAGSLVKSLLYSHEKYEERKNN